MNDWFEAEQHVERAHEAYEAGRWDEAESELREALARNPYQAEWQFNLGLTLEAAGRHADAMDAFARASSLNTEDAQSPLYAGINALRAERPTDALQWLERAERLEPASVEVCVHRIEAFAMLGEHDNAETAFYLGQSIEPDEPELYAAMAESLMDRKQYDKAVWCLREAARLDPELPRVQARLAEAYAATGRTERARQLYLRELRKYPGDTDTLLDLGDLLMDMGRLDEAGEKFRRVLEIQPDCVDAHFALGELAERRGDAPTALRQYEVVLRLNPGYPAARRRVAQLVLDRVREDDRALVHRLLRMELADVRARPDSFNNDDLDTLGNLLLDAGLTREADQVFARLIDREPGSCRYHHLRSVALLESGKTVAGLEEVRRALAINPRFVPAIHNLALGSLRQGQWMRARYWIRQGLSIDREDSALRRLRVRLRLRAIGDLLRWVTRSAGGAFRQG